MKKLKNILVVLTISISLIGVFLFSSISDNKKIKLDTERNISHSISLIEKIDLKDNFDVVKIIRDSLFLISWKKPNKGNLYFYDKSSKNVKKYFSIGDDILIGDYYENSKEDFVILNKAQERLLSISRGGKINDTVNLNMPISRGLLIDNYFYYLAYGKDVKMRFYKRNLGDENFKEIHNTIVYENKKNTGVVYDGVLKYSNGQIILTPYAKNEVLFFDKDFKFDSKMKLINEDREYKFTTMQNGDVLPDVNNIYPNIFSDINNNKLYVLTNDFGVWDVKDNYYIDVYDIKNKKYILTYPIKDKSIFPREILISDNLLYILGKNKLNIYEIKQ